MTIFKFHTLPPFSLSQPDHVTVHRGSIVSTLQYTLQYSQTFTTQSLLYLLLHQKTNGEQKKKYSQVMERRGGPSVNNFLCSLVRFRDSKAINEVEKKENIVL